jgi:large subunit ribosomal protein L21
MYAVIETCGKQIRVSQGDVIKVREKIGESETEIEIDKVLLISKNDNIFLGKPYLENASVKAEIKSSGRDSKILVFKQKPRKGFRNLRGHRQDFTVLMIKDIVFGG